MSIIVPLSVAVDIELEANQAFETSIKQAEDQCRADLFEKIKSVAGERLADPESRAKIYAICKALVNVPGRMGSHSIPVESRELGRLLANVLVGEIEEWC